MALLQSLGLSLQTELVVITLLGMANSTLDWKPFELMVRLNVIRDLSFDSAHFGVKITAFVKSLLSTTVVIEFLCGLLNPFAHLLKLYPIITMSRSDALLPWLVIHAVNTMLPKVLSFGLISVLYFDNVISTVFFLEFLFVEMINISIALYNWYVFFEFYLNLRELEYRRQRDLHKNQLQACSSSPNVSATASQSSVDSNGSKEPRVARSLASLAGDASSTSSLPSTIDTPMKLAKEEPEHEVGIPDRSAEIEESGNAGPLEDSSDAKTEHGPSLDDFLSSKCTCSSSEDEKKPSKQPREDKKGVDRAHAKVLRKVRHSGSKRPKKSSITEKSPPETMALAPSASRVLSLRRDAYYKRSDNFHFLLNKNFQLLSEMCRASGNGSQSASRNSSQKWSVFHHKLESTLDGNPFLKEASSFVGFGKLQREGGMTHDEYKGKGYSLDDREGTEADGASSVVELTKFPQTSVTCEKKKIYLSHQDRSKKSRTELTENQNARELRSLQAYNGLTLELDRREMLQKKKKSKLTGHGALEDTTTLDRHRKSARDVVGSPANPVSRGIGVLEAPKKSQSMRETVRKIDWNNSPASSGASTSHGKPASPSRADPGEESELVIADDETLCLLRNAFSFSDESERGFHLGPDASEPYPIFQCVALSMAEVIKSTDWRSFERALPSQRDHDIEIPSTDDGVFVFEEDGIVERARDNSCSEAEKRRRVTTRLLEQMEQLLASSREVMSVVEDFTTRRDPRDRSPIFKNGNIDTLDYLVAGPKEHVIGARNTYVCNVVGLDDANKKTEIDRTSEPVGSAARKNGDKNTKTRSRPMHHSRRGEGLTSGNIMEYNSDGTIMSQNSSLFVGSSLTGTAAGLSRTNDDSDNKNCDQIQDVSKFVSSFVAKDDKDAQEVELNSSDLGDNACARLHEASGEKDYYGTLLRAAEESRNAEASAVRKRETTRVSDGGNRQLLDLDVMKRWMRDSEDSLDDGEYRPWHIFNDQTISFSDGSDMEDFPAD